MAKKPRILCIDDQLENLRIRTIFLQQFGCEVIVAPDHRSALQAVSSQDIDLLIIDYHLAKGETGEDIARDVRVMRPRLPMVMLTGDYRVPESAAQSVDAVLIKGASDPNVLLELIARLVPDAELHPCPTNLNWTPRGKAS